MPHCHQSRKNKNFGHLNGSSDRFLSLFEFPVPAASLTQCLTIYGLFQYREKGHISSTYALLSGERRTTVVLLAPGDVAFTTSGKGGGGFGLAAFLGLAALVFPSPFPLVEALADLAAFPFAAFGTTILSDKSSTAFSKVISSGVEPSGKETFVFPHLM